MQNYKIYANFENYIWFIFSMNTQIDRYVIDKIKSKRVKFGISQAELADKMGLSNSFIGKIESSKFSNKYAIHHLNLLAKIFSCSPKDFLPQNPIEEEE